MVRLLPALILLPLLGEEAPRRTVEEIARASRDAVVAIHSSDRVGERRGAGSGFFIRGGEAGGAVLVTNLHVIGEGRAFTVELTGGETLRPETIIAFDRDNDLAIVALERGDLPVLSLGDSGGLLPGQQVLAVGNVLGLGLSVMQGSIAPARSIEGRNLLQLAMPIEPGASGSPVIDLEGRAVGVLAMQSGRNSGFAVPASDVMALLSRANPMPMKRWLRIGALDPELWRPLLGGEWRQRAGRLLAAGTGAGFGGRMLCVHEGSPPGGSFDLAVEVKLEDESGAAGLLFHADGGDKHYGFYPTAGSLRLTSFEGPDVFTWRIIQTVSSTAYRPGDWNEIRVRVRESRLTCLVNGKVVIEAEDSGLPPGSVGLVKFREPKAEFRRFRVAPELPDAAVAKDLSERIAALADRLTAAPELSRGLVEEVSSSGLEAPGLLRERAASLDRQAARLRAAADRAGGLALARELHAALASPEAEIDLLRAAFLIARADNPDLEVAPYLEQVERMGRGARAAADARTTAADKLEAVIRHFCDDLGFRGSRTEYYHRSNSYMNEVIDDREGIPITLTVLFMDVARRAGLDVAGVAAPGHFLARLENGAAEPGEVRLIDIFSGKVISLQEAEKIWGLPPGEEDLAPAAKRAIVSRMIRNLLGCALREGDEPVMLRYLDLILAVDETSAIDRWLRARLRFRAKDIEGAEDDLGRLLDHGIPGVPRSDVEELLEAVRNARR